MKDTKFSMTLLFDYYGDLLTDKQKTYFDLYYNQDFSLAEIAEEEGVSRQAVSDAITRTEAILQNFEDKTGFVKKAAERKGLVEAIRKEALALQAVAGAEERAKAILSACDKIKE